MNPIKFLLKRIPRRAKFWINQGIKIVNCLFSLGFCLLSLYLIVNTSWLLTVLSVFGCLIPIAAFWIGAVEAVANHPEFNLSDEDIDDILGKQL